MERNRMTNTIPIKTPSIEARALTKRYKDQDAVDGLDLSIQPGSIYALLGPNGAGKTTALKMLMGIIEPTEGDCGILGSPSHRMESSTYQRIGYVSENQKLPDWMTLDQLLRYLRPCYPKWDQSLESKLLRDYDLPLDKKLKAMSRGMRMKTKFLISLVYHPDILVLDEPFSGLDPVIREECIDGLLDWAQPGSRTALISSHDIEDVERIADSVGIIEKGKLELDEEVDSLKDRIRRVSVMVSENTDLPRSLPSGWKSARSNIRNIEFIDTEFDSEKSEGLIHAILPGVESVSFEPMNLRDIYVALVKQKSREKGGKYGSELNR